MRVEEEEDAAVLPIVFDLTGAAPDDDDVLDRGGDRSGARVGRKGETRESRVGEWTEEQVAMRVVGGLATGARRP